MNLLIFLMATLNLSKNLDKGLAIKPDTIIVAKVIDQDSLHPPVKNQRIGDRYYYGTHHFKIVSIDVRNNDIHFSDTLTVVNIFNLLNNYSIANETLNVEVGKIYVFYLNTFNPFKTDFIRLEGNYKGNGFFYPEQSRLIKRYNKISRVIHLFEYK
jgi:hypothetical protein